MANRYSGMIGAAGGDLGNAGALPGGKAGKEVADLFRGMQQQQQTPSFMPGIGASLGGGSGYNMGQQMSGNPYSSVGNSLGMLTGQNIAFNPLAGMSEIGQKVGGKLKDFLNRPLMPDTINPNTGNSIYFDAMPPETQKRFKEVFNKEMNKGY